MFFSGTVIDKELRKIELVGLMILERFLSVKGNCVLKENNL